MSNYEAGKFDPGEGDPVAGAINVAMERRQAAQPGKPFDRVRQLRTAPLDQFL